MAEDPSNPIPGMGSAAPPASAATQPDKSQPWPDKGAQDQSGAAQTAHVETPNPEELDLENLLKKKQRNATVSMFGILIGLIVVIAVLYLLFFRPMPHVTTTTTTVNGPNIGYLSSCSNITQPGIYYLTKDIQTLQQAGSCIYIKSSNVKLLGQQHLILGSGPFVQAPPFTSGVRLQSVSNVTVSQLNVSKFSYGIYLNGSSHNLVQGVTLRNMTMVGLYFYQSGNNTVKDSKTEQAQSSQGSIYLLSGGNNTISNTTIEYNNLFGVRMLSSGNRFINDQFVGNPTDLVCQGTTGFRISNKFSGSTCIVNSQCNFAYCQQRNDLLDLSAINLSASISSCGSIASSGSYVLSNSLDMRDYVNTSEAAAKQVPCIDIRAPNVRLDCRNNSISNGAYGIYSAGNYNITLKNCNADNNTYGMFLADDLRVNITGGMFTNNRYGILIYNSTYGNLTNTIFLNNTYGLYLNSSSLYQAVGYKAHRNNFGVFLNGSSQVVFSGGNTTSNVKSDFFCSAAEYNYTTNHFFSNNSCGVTDCKWAYPQSCAKYVLPPILFFPINNCTTITAKGNYSFTGQAYTSSGTCFTIKASNVSINCRNFKINSANPNGAAFVINNQSNVSISNCNINTFMVGISASNDKNLALSNMSITNVQNAMLFSTINQSLISNIIVKGYSSIGAMFNTLSNSNVSYVSLNASAGNQTGFEFINAKNSIISFDSTSFNHRYGFYFNSSRNNTIYNNTALSDIGADYFCSADSSGLNSQKNGINSGLSKKGCAWLIELRSSANPPQCYPVTTPQLITFSQDWIYPYNQTCYNLHNGTTSTPSGTVINCQYHTIFASAGGEFASLVGARNIKIENCYFKGFTSPIMSRNSSVTVLNNTFTGANVSVDVENYYQGGISILNNTILKSTSGIYIKNANLSSIQRNNIGNVTTGIQSVNSSIVSIMNNTVSSSSTGILISNNYQDRVFNNVVHGSQHGFACYGASAGSTSQNLDLGQNSCSNSNYQCSWLHC